MAPVKKKPAIKSASIVAKVYPLLEDSVEGGLKYGINRMFKHRDSDTITQDELLGEALEGLVHHVMSDICERFRFPDEHEG